MIFVVFFLEKRFKQKLPAKLYPYVAMVTYSQLSAILSGSLLLFQDILKLSLFQSMQASSLGFMKYR